MKLLTKSDKLISGLKKIEIEDSISLVNYLPYRYEEFFYDDETSFYDKKRVVIKGKLNASPRLVKTSSVDITIFYFRSIKGNLYVVKAFNHRYLKNILNTNITKKVGIGIVLIIIFLITVNAYSYTIITEYIINTVNEKNSRTLINSLDEVYYKITMGIVKKNQDRITNLYYKNVGEFEIHQSTLDEFVA